MGAKQEANQRSVVAEALFLGRIEVKLSFNLIDLYLRISEGSERI